MSSGYISYTASNNNTSTVSIPCYIVSGSYVGVDWGKNEDYSWIVTLVSEGKIEEEKVEDKKEELTHEELKSEI